MIEFNDLGVLKERFGKLLSKLYYSASLSLEQISHIVLNHDFFSFLERNDTKSFLNESYSDIARECAGVELLFEDVPYSPVYWAGLQYINIATKARVPLRQVFLLCSLSEMVAHYEIYHEMHESQLIDEFLVNEYRRPILTLLMRERGISTSGLSKLTGIPENTLSYYKRENANLFNASFANIEIIKRALCPCSLDFFKGKSLFVPVTKRLFDDPEFVERLRKNACEYYHLDMRTELFLSQYEKNGKEGIYIGRPVSLVVGKYGRKPIEDNILLGLVDASL